MRQRIPAEITHVYGHQEEAIRAIRGGRTTLVSTGTGSGKTECFLYPIVSRCLELRDEGAPAGIGAVIVYPMNALAEDQLGACARCSPAPASPSACTSARRPRREGEVAGIRLPAGASRADYEAKLAEVRREKRSDTVYPPEEVCSREVMRTAGRQPRILLTNVKQLELLLTRQRDVELFAGARLDFLVFDEAHTFTGAQGAETACLIRRLRAFCGREAQRDGLRRDVGDDRRQRTPTRRATSRRASSACRRTTSRRWARRTSARSGPGRARAAGAGNGRRGAPDACVLRGGGRRRRRSAVRAVYRDLAGERPTCRRLGRGAATPRSRTTSSSTSSASCSPRRRHCTNCRRLLERRSAGR